MRPSINARISNIFNQSIKKRLGTKQDHTVCIHTPKSV
uniref:Uncharacterized protein n=1 Tax=Anguilla anguilla TaxID=7936 RepID=A0A0E9WX23_ANGAN